MVCGACSTAFEVETAGTRIRLAAAPPALAGRTPSLLGVWLTPAELGLLVEQATPATPGSPFEPLSAALAAGSEQSAPAAAAETVPRLNSAAKAATAPRAANTAALAPAEPEPGTEDWFASLAALIGGQSPIQPPPNEVLADELERALLGRPENGTNGASATDPPIAVVGSGILPTAPEPEGGPEPEPDPAPIASAPVKPAAPKSADVVLAEAIAERAAAQARTTAATDAERVSAPVPGPAPVVPAPPMAERLAAPVPAPTPPPGVAPKVERAALAASTPSANPGPALAPAGVRARAAAVAEPAPAAASRRELAERAWMLHEMGNSLASIQGALESSGGTPDDVSVIMAKLNVLEQARRERFSRTVRQGLFAAVLVIGVLLVVAIVLGSLRPSVAATGRATVAASGSPSNGTPGPTGTGPSGTQPAPEATLAYNAIIALLNQMLPGDEKIANGPSPTSAPTSAVLGVLFSAPATPTLSAEDLATEAARKAGLPSWVATLVPNGLVVLGVPTPSFDNAGPPNSPCPASADQAAALFGGPASAWSYNHDQQGWIFILADKPTSIRIPANMTAGYLVIGQSLQMRSVAGPVTLHNINFVAVSCQ